MSETDTDIIAIVGTCAAERARYAARLSEVTGRTVIPEARLRQSLNPVDEALALAPWVHDTGAVIELPADTRVIEFIHAAHQEASQTSLSDIVCVADALHLIDDFRSDSYAGRTLLRDAQDPTALTTEYVSRALISMHHIEYASKVVLVNWDGMSTSNLAALMALVSHLNPHASLWLDNGSLGPDPLAACESAAAVIQPGWVSVINGSHQPRITDSRIRSLHYEQLRPFHPSRLETLFDERIDAGDFGAVIRSAGFCRLATRPHTLARWEHVGHVLSFLPLAEHSTDSISALMRATGQNLAFFGIDLATAELRTALDTAVLTDAELSAGVDTWAGYPDPFPAWPATRNAAPEG